MKQASLRKILGKECLDYTVRVVIVLVLITGHFNVLFGKNSVVTYTDKEGLPRNVVSCFVKDNYGYGWVGTGNGIAKFDGYSFIAYEPLEGRTINTMIVDAKNQLWVGSDRGLYKYNRINDSFELKREGYIRQLSYFQSNIYFLLPNKLVKIAEDASSTDYDIEGIISYAVTHEGTWVNVHHQGIHLLETTDHYLNQRNTTLIKEVRNVLYIACRNGELLVMDKNRKITKASIDNRHSIMDIEYINNSLWVATDGNGILVLDLDHNVIDHIKKEPNEKTLIPSNSIYDICKGLNQAIWISTYGAGLSCIVSGNDAFSNFQPEKGNSNSLIDKEGVAVFVTPNSFYFGTNYGFSVVDKSKKEYQNIDAFRLDKELNGTKVTAIYKNNDLWIGTYDGGIGKYSSELKLIKSYYPCSRDRSEMQRVVAIYPLDENALLIGTQHREKSLIKLNLQTEEVSAVEQKLLSNKTYFQVNSIRKNQFGELIILIRDKGVFLYNQDSNTLEDFVPEINNRVTFKINDFYHDKKGNYWFATQAEGLIRMSTDGRIFNKWTAHDGFPTNSLLRIESINDSILWISSISGLCRFNINTEQLQIYNYRHGLASNEFMPRTSTVTPDGQIIFGNYGGFVMIDPPQLKPDTINSNVIISDISFHNQSIKEILSHKVLSKPLEETAEISLPYNRNSFTLRFFTRDDYLPKFNNFEYRLLGLEEEWIYLGENNQTTYTNLSPGKYVFEVRSTNKSNIWNEHFSSLVIQIHPPWYLTWLAFLIYFVSVIATGLLILRFYLRRLELKKEVEISEYKIKKEHELTEKKLAFFTNISHDLKTPLTLIASPVNDLLRSDNLRVDQLRKLELINRNAARLYRLINDLLNFRKITQNQLPLKVQMVDLMPTIIEIYEAAQPECEKRGIKLELKYNGEYKVCVDVKKIEKVLWNLLANAMNFTDEGGSILLSLDLIQREERSFLRLLVKDNGKGFSEAEKKKIFNRFYQVQKSDGIQFDSSGIGLSIVSDLVKIHHGKIDVESEESKGTAFTITIPAAEVDYEKSEKRDEFLEVASKGPFYNYLSSESEYLDDKQEFKKYNQYKLLIIEDNLELNEYLSSHFRENYKVFQAKDGVEGLKYACKVDPDIIITDVLMPKLDGYELTKQIRENFVISHIPIVMLSANSTIDHQVEGLVHGADVYITKPFEIKYLDAVLRGLLKNRKRIRERFLGIDPLDKDTEGLSKSDIEFVNGLKDFIQENLTNENLNIDLLTKHFGYSRTQLNRKIKALTNLTPNNYIKTIRLMQAYELIKKEGVRVSDAAYMTGFTDPNYFTICFKKEFGENPSQVSVDRK